MTGALTGVRGAANGAAMVRPLRARPSVLTIVHVVMGRTLASRNGRVANFIRPLAAISSGPGTGALHRVGRCRAGLDTAQP